MPSMKSFSVNRIKSTIKKRTGSGLSGNGGPSNDTSTPPENETLEGCAVRSLKQFCESGGPNKQGDEVLFLPPIVEAAESSPNAAAECARHIRKYFSKDYHAKPSWQYNAIMVMRILADNPGPGFTRNFDKKFVDATGDLLRHGRDPSVRQILMETLDDFEKNKQEDGNLAGLITMWQKERDRVNRHYSNPNAPQGPNPGMMQSPSFLINRSENYFARHHTNRKLPKPEELASRLEEARTSAKLLSQVVVNTPPQELLDNDLVKEFSDRCQSASRSIQAYMIADDPAPDNDTMESLIDTNEQVQTALNQHQRAVLGARKQLGLNVRSEENLLDATPNLMSSSNGGANSGFGQAPAVPPPDTRPQLLLQQSQASSSSSMPGRAGAAAPLRKPIGNGKGKETGGFEPPPGPPPGIPPKQGMAGVGAGAGPGGNDVENPFLDPQPGSGPAAGGFSGYGMASPSAVPAAAELPSNGPRPAHEPYHPGFQQTPSYLHRQESAYDHTTMHGAVANPGAQATPGVQTQGERNVWEQPEQEDIYGSNDLYDSAPKRGGPANR